MRWLRKFSSFLTQALRVLCCSLRYYEVLQQALHNSALFTFEILSRTATGEMCPITVTLFDSKSILNDVTPEIEGLKTLVKNMLTTTSS